jgi:hypothetical protein
MAQSFDLREQAGRCRRLARGSTDTTLRASLLDLADEYTARAAALEGGERPIRNAGPDDQGAA